ncbi:hypothetical protein J2X85_004230 [Microbacterium trichothecenolyticum]|nr:hypothetical protein [Microbacterium trichothecenolyticum]
MHHCHIGGEFDRRPPERPEGGRVNPVESHGSPCSNTGAFSAASPNAIAW